MAERKETVEDKKAEDVERARRLNREGSSQNPDRAEDYDRKSDWKREKLARVNYEEARDQDDDEYKARRTI